MIIYASNLSYVYIIYEKTPTEIDTLWCMMMFGDVPWYVMISDDEDYVYKIMCVRLCVSLSAQERASHRNTVECLPQDAAAQAEPPAEVPQNSLGRCQEVDGLCQMDLQLTNSSYKIWLWINTY